MEEWKKAVWCIDPELAIRHVLVLALYRRVDVHSFVGKRFTCLRRCGTCPNGFRQDPSKICDHIPERISANWDRPCSGPGKRLLLLETRKTQRKQACLSNAEGPIALSVEWTG